MEKRRIKNYLMHVRTIEQHLKNENVLSKIYQSLLSQFYELLMRIITEKLIARSDFYKYSSRQDFVPVTGLIITSMQSRGSSKSM